jgi:hypothetical protein
MPAPFVVLASAVIGVITIILATNSARMPKQLLIAPSYSAPTAPIYGTSLASRGTSPPCPLTFELTAEQTKHNVCKERVAQLRQLNIDCTHETTELLLSAERVHRFSQWNSELVQTELTARQGNLDGNISLIADLRTNITELQGYHNANISLMADLRNNTAVLQRYHNGNISLMAVLQRYHDGNISLMADLRTNITEACSNITELQSNITELRSNITELQGYRNTTDYLHTCTQDLWNALLNLCDDLQNRINGWMYWAILWFCRQVACFAKHLAQWKSLHTNRSIFIFFMTLTPEIGVGAICWYCPFTSNDVGSYWLAGLAVLVVLIGCYWLRKRVKKHYQQKMEVGIKSELDLKQRKLRYMHHLDLFVKNTSKYCETHKIFVNTGQCELMEQEPAIKAFRTLIVELAENCSKENPIPWSFHLDGLAETLASFLRDVQQLTSPTYEHAKLVSKDLKLDITLCAVWKHIVTASSFAVELGSEVREVNGCSETHPVPSTGLNALRKQVADMHTAWAKLPQ